MRKFSASNGEGDNMVQSELSRGGYVTADYGVEITNYLVHLPSHNDFIVETDVEEELNYWGNDGHLDDDGDN